MNCAEFKNIVHEFAQAEARAANTTLSAAMAVSARFHAETCESCAAQLREAQVLARALRLVAQDSVQVAARPYVEMSLMDAFREHRRNRERIRDRQRRSRLRWAQCMAVGAAAIVLFALGAWRFSRLHMNHRSNSETYAITSNANPTAQPGANSEESAADSDFVPLPYGENFSTDDPGVVVRVSIMRNALEKLGYPVDEGRGDDVVQADLVVGEDGWPRAVRLVQ